MSTYVKDPDATLDYGINWTPWLDGDTITTSQWFIDTGVTQVGSDTFDDTSTKVFIGGGTPGEKYELVNRITTAGQRTDERTIFVRIRQR